MPLMNVGRLSMALSPTNAAYKLYMGRRFSAFGIPIMRGDGGPRNVKARVAVFKTLWKFLRIISVIITKLMK